MGRRGLSTKAKQARKRIAKTRRIPVSKAPIGLVQSRIAPRLTVLGRAVPGAKVQLTTPRLGFGRQFVPDTEKALKVLRRIARKSGKVSGAATQLPPFRKKHK